MNLIPAKSRILTAAAQIAASTAKALQNVSGNAGASSKRGVTGRKRKIKKLRAGRIVVRTRGSRKSCHCHPIRNHQ